MLINSLVKSCGNNYTYYNFVKAMPLILAQNRRGFGGASRKLPPKEGNLDKKTSNGKRWQKKHCELERGQLHYYEGKGQKYSDTIRLRDLPIEIDPTDPKVIAITTESRVFYFRAESAASASSWFSALKSHSKGLV